VEVLEGVAAGADVVVGGLQQVREGSPVRIVTLPGSAPATPTPATAQQPAPPAATPPRT
jgi:hypothetical protein